MLRIRLLLCIVAALMLRYVNGLGQDIIRTDPNNLPVICFAGEPGTSSRIPPPEEFHEREGSSSRTKSASITVEYVGFPERARNAFEYAVSIWESLLVTPVEIHVAAVWANLPYGTLGSAGPSFWAANFKGTPKYNIYYPGPLAEKLAGEDLNDPGEYDIVAQFNGNVNWYYKSTGTPDSVQYDFITVALHELAHGLGFTSTFEVINDVGMYGRYTDTGAPFVFDVFLENGTGTNLFESFESRSAELATQLTSNNLNFAPAFGLGTASVFAPSVYIGGSSISHLDPHAYPQGSPNSLMRPHINPEEINHNPGAVTQEILTSMGWVTTYISHEHLEDREDVSNSIEVKAVITADDAPGYAFFEDQVVISYIRSDNSEMFTTVMQPNGTPNEFVAVLPAPGSEITYSYRIEVTDNLGRTLYSPGEYYDPNAAPGLKGPSSSFYTFKTGQDNVGPDIVHTPKAFISYLDEDLIIEAEITEGNGILEAQLELMFHGDAATLTDLSLVGSDPDPFNGTTVYRYRATIPISPGQLQDGDKVTYRIIAVDNAHAANESILPATGYFEIPVLGLLPSRTHYTNHFGAPTDDFITDTFTMGGGYGLGSGALHSPHPYPEAGAGNQLNLTCQLRIPIVVSSHTSLMTFDEIVAVEPGEDGSVFGDPDFYDYVAVEGSRDGGKTWEFLADPYDSREDLGWVYIYKSNLSRLSESYYKRRVIDLRDTFSPGEEVVIRFRLFSDPFGSGWGWAIANLRIQVDDTPPEILHNLIDYELYGSQTITFPVAVSDNLLVDKVLFEYLPGTQDRDTVVVGNKEGVGGFTVDVSGLGEGTTIRYRFTAIDSAGNVTELPPKGYFETVLVQFRDTVDHYNGTIALDTDFVGNFISAQVDNNKVNIHSSHPYPAGFGTTHTSDFALTLLKKIRVSDTNPHIRFDEIALVQPADNAAAFGTPEFRDYVVVEGSKDEGKTWHPFEDGYNAREGNGWHHLYTQGQGTNPSDLNYRRQFIDLTASGDFISGDVILIRFRLFSDESNTGWGWHINDLHIQDEVTGIDDGPIAKFLMHPNPVINTNTLTIELQPQAPGAVHVSVLNAVGHEVYRTGLSVSPQIKSYPLDVTGLANGVYVLRLNFGSETVTRKFAVAR